MKRSAMETAGWAVLGLLLLATLTGAVRLDRSKLPLLGDEATYAMQAASLAWDFDLAYTKEDYDRFVASWGVPPAGLILQSRPGSDRLVFAKPPLYALVTAPFVRVSPVRGGVVANALLLAAASLLAALALRKRLGEAAPLWVAAFVFASVAFGAVFWGEADLFLLASVAAGFALIYGGDRAASAPASIYQGEDTVPAGRIFGRFAAGGALLAVAGAYRPFYLILLVPAALAALGFPTERRRSALSGVMIGALALLLVSMGIQRAAGGDWTGYGGQRQGIYERSSYPAVDFPASAWSEQVEQRGNASWLRPGIFTPRLAPRLLGWNLVYFLAGQTVGVLPYFLPLILGFLAFSRDRGRWALPVAVAVAAGCFLLLLPFDFAGGGAFANRYFLPLYPALWFLAGRPARPAWALLVAALAAPFLLPLWTHPTAYPVEQGELRHVSDLARRILPYETSQSALPGPQVSVGGGLWAKLLTSNVWPAERGRGLRVAGEGPASLLVVSPQPLDALLLDMDRRAPTKIVVNGEELRPALLKADGGVVFVVPLPAARAVHPIAWSPYDHHFYALDLRLPGAPAAPIGFGVEPASRDLIQRGGG
ncbi:MAG TPA: hypothetical protein VJ725_13490 [Thermoanaerobaculia bacterium]|nr:hypothetical protein [Thermoanaerobaculia bacterium]